MLSERELDAKPSALQVLSADAYIFDIDGTLLVTRDLVHWNGLHQAMLETYGVDTTIEGLSYHGKTDIGILRMALERCEITGAEFEERLPTALATICREVSANCSELRPEVCPCIPDLLSRLRQEGKLLGVASGNLEIVGWHKISAAGLRDFFSFGCFGDECEARADIFGRAVLEARKRLGEPATICFIGDTPDDVRAARQVNARIISVGTGVHCFEELAALRPDYCCHSCSELVALFP
ncbi:MAG: HAD family hydrolase [Acidobacteriaceae bacterium]|nr:HAD family hydrolase [Acidobacteriaceae bacterium]